MHREFNLLYNKPLKEINGHCDKLIRNHALYLWQKKMYLQKHFEARRHMNMCIQHETKQNNATPSHVRTKQVSLCLSLCPLFTLLVAYKLHTWMGNKDKGGRCSRGTKLSFALFFLLKTFFKFWKPFCTLCSRASSLLPPPRPSTNTHT